MRHDDDQPPRREDAGHRLLVIAMRTTRLRPSAGVTLIELMTVIGVAAILAAVAAPSFSTFIDNQRLRNASFDLVTDLLQARNEALSRQRVVVMSPASLSGSDWSGGWSLNLDTAAGEVLTSRTGLSSRLLFSGGPGSLQFRSDGRIATANPISITVKYASPAPANVSPSCIRIDATGRARADKGACT